jgi:hypothetical protein
LGRICRAGGGGWQVEEDAAEAAAAGSEPASPLEGLRGALWAGFRAEWCGGGGPAALLARALAEAAAAGGAAAVAAAVGRADAAVLSRLGIAA